MGCNMMIKKLFLPVVAAAVLVLNAAEVGSVKFIQEGGNPIPEDILNVSLLDHPGQQQGQQKQHTDHAGGKIEGKASGDDFGNKAQSEYDEDLTRENQRRSPRKKQNRVPVSGAHIVYPLIEQKSISVGIEDDYYLGVFCGKRGENPAEFR